MSNLVQIKDMSPKEWVSEIEALENKNLTEADIKEVATEIVQNLVEQLEDISTDLEEAKRLTRRARDTESDLVSYIPIIGSWFGETKTEKTARLNTRVNSMQNEAMDKMNVLMQESIKLTTISTLFSNAMIQVMSAMMVDEIKDRDGNIIHLSEATKDSMNAIMQQAQNFVNHQKKFEDHQKAIDSKLQQQIEKDKEHDLKLQQQIEKDIEHDLKLQEQVEKDKEHDMHIETLYNKLKERQEIFDQHQIEYEKRQEAQEKMIKSLKTQLAQVKISASSLYVSILALLGAIAGVCLHWIL